MDIRTHRCSSQLYQRLCHTARENEWNPESRCGQRGQGQPTTNLQVSSGVD